MTGNYPAGAMPRQNIPVPMPRPAPFAQHMRPRSHHSSSSYSSSQSSYPSSYPCPPSPPQSAVPRDLRPRDASRISDVRHERMTEAEARELLSSFVVVRLERVRSPNDVDSHGYPLMSSWERVRQIEETNFPQEDARRKVAQLNIDTKPAYEKKAGKDSIIQRQIELVLDDYARKERDHRYEYTLAQFESHYRKRRKSSRHHHGRRSRRHSSRSRSPRKERQAITIYLKRTPTKEQDGLRMYREKSQQRAMQERPAVLPTVHLHPSTAGYPPVSQPQAPIYSAPAPHHPQARSPPTPHQSPPPTRSAPPPHHPAPTHGGPPAPVNPAAPQIDPRMGGQFRPPMGAKPGVPAPAGHPLPRAQSMQPQPESDGESGEESGEESDEEDTMPANQSNPAQPKAPGMAPRTAPAPAPARPGAAPMRPDGAAVPLPKPGPGNFPANPSAAPGPRGPQPNLQRPNVAPGARGPPLNPPVNPNAGPGVRGPPPNPQANPNAAAARGPLPTAPNPAPVPNHQAAVPPPGRAAPPAQAPGVNTGRMPPQGQPKFNPQAPPQKPGVGAPDLRPQPNGQVKLQKPPVGSQVNAPGSPVTADDHIIVTTITGGKSRRKSKEYQDSDRSSRHSMASDDCFSAVESEGTGPSSVSSDSGSRQRRRQPSSTQAQKDLHEDVRDSRRTRRDSDEERSRHVSRPRARFDSSPRRRGESSHRRRESPQRRGDSTYHRMESPRRRRESSYRRRESPRRQRDESRSPRRDYDRDDREWVPRRRDSTLSPRVVQRNPGARLVSAPEAQREIYADQEMSRKENRLERARREDSYRDREIRRDNDRLRDLGDSFRHRRGLRSRFLDLLGDDFTHTNREPRWHEGEAREYMRRADGDGRYRPLRDREGFRRD